MRAALALVGLASIAHANSDDLVGRALVLDRGELEAQVTLALAARPGRFGDPYTVSPDIWFGITPDLTAGIIHSARSVDEIDADRSLAELGIDVRYRIHRFVAPRARFVVRDTDPWKPAMTLGAIARWQRGRFAVTTDPYLRLGLANTDRGNRAAINIPVWLAVQPTCKWMAALRFGYDSALAVARDGYHVPIALVAGVHPIAPLEIFLELGFRSLIGPQHDSRERMLSITVGWRQPVR